MFQVIGRDTASFVLDLQLHPRWVAGLRQKMRMDLNDPVAVRHRIQGIQQQIQQDLLDLLSIKREWRS